MFCKWIHPILWTNLVCRHVFTVKPRVFHMMTRVSSDPVWLVSNSFKTRDNWQNTCIHVNTHENTYWWSGTNYEPVWHMPTGSEMVPCLLGNNWQQQLTMKILLDINIKVARIAPFFCKAWPVHQTWKTTAYICQTNQGTWCVITDVIAKRHDE